MKSPPTLPRVPPNPVPASPVDADHQYLRTAFGVKDCPECQGTGGFVDTTYDRTGTWSLCRECKGYGEIVDPIATAKLLGFTLWKK
jgi:hypothetical protein